MTHKKSLVESTIKDTLTKTGFDFNGGILTLGVSGGPDSTALFASLANLKSEFGFSLRAIYVDHGLRKEAEQEAEFVRDLSDKFEADFESVKVDTLGYQNSNKLSQEESARQLRYKALSKNAEKMNSRYIVVGHTRDDQLETILMNLMRGTGLDGLKGMEIISKVPPLLDFDTNDNISIIRPLLNISKTEVNLYLTERNLTSMIDDSNNSSQYSRNRVRNELIPVMENIRTGSKDSILRTAKSVHLLSNYLDETASNLLGECLRDTTDNSICLDRGLFSSYHPSIQIQIFRLVIDTILKSTSGILAVHWESMQKLASNGSTGSYLKLPNNIYVNVTKKELILSIGPWHCPLPEIAETIIKKNGITIAGEWLFDTAKENGFLYMKAKESKSGHISNITQLSGPLNANLKLTDATLAVRKREIGDKIKIKKGHKKIKSLLNEANIPQHWRDNIPIIYEKETGEIVWVVGVRQV